VRVISDLFLRNGERLVLAESGRVSLGGLSLMQQIGQTDARVDQSAGRDVRVAVDDGREAGVVQQVLVGALDTVFVVRQLHDAVEHSVHCQRAVHC